jgi:hypothetical protein
MVVDEGDGDAAAKEWPFTRARSVIPAASRKLGDPSSEPREAPLGALKSGRAPEAGQGRGDDVNWNCRQPDEGVLVGTGWSPQPCRKSTGGPSPASA